VVGRRRWRGDNGSGGATSAKGGGGGARGQEDYFRRTRHVCLQIGVMPLSPRQRKLGFLGLVVGLVMTVAVVPSRLALKTRRRSLRQERCRPASMLRLAYRVARLSAIRRWRDVALQTGGVEDGGRAVL
jgi:hypothetical protein